MCVNKMHNDHETFDWHQAARLTEMFYTDYKMRALIQKNIHLSDYWIAKINWRWAFFQMT